MSDPINNSWPAFPYHDEGQSDPLQREHFQGMSLRDYFAAKALSGLATNKISYEDSTAKFDMTLMAKDAYYIADAMLAERNNRK